MYAVLICILFSNGLYKCLCRLIFVLLSLLGKFVQYGGANRHLLITHCLH